MGSIDMPAENNITHKVYFYVCRMAHIYIANVALNLHTVGKATTTTLYMITHVHQAHIAATTNPPPFVPSLSSQFAINSYLHENHT